MKWVWAPLVCGFLAAPVQALAQGFDGHSLLIDKFSQLSLPVPTRWRVVYCHGFGCSARTEIGLNSSDVERLSGLMAAGRASSSAERKAIAQAVAWYERRAAAEAGTAHAVARPNRKYPGGDPGQMDCIDTSTNTLTLLYVLDELHLLHHHSIELPVSKHMILDGGGPHTTAVLLDRKSAVRWAFDPWTHNNGELPDVMPLDSWMVAE